jgi:stress response protein SCP2
MKHASPCTRKLQGVTNKNVPSTKLSKNKASPLTTLHWPYLFLRYLEAVSFMTPTSSDGSIVHMGDNVRGIAAGDDEAIKVSLIRAVSSKDHR